MKRFATEDLEIFLQSEEPTPVQPLPTDDYNETSWEDFLVQSDSDPSTELHFDGNPVPPGFTAVNSTLDSKREFTARQILLNAELTPATSPEQSPARTESDSASPIGQTPAETPLLDTVVPVVVAERIPLGDVTAPTCGNKNSMVQVPEKRPREDPRDGENMIKSKLIQRMQYPRNHVSQT
jgi:hypothetical protein